MPSTSTKAIAPCLSDLNFIFLIFLFVVGVVVLLLARGEGVTAIALPSFDSAASTIDELASAVALTSAAAAFLLVLFEEEKGMGLLFAMRFVGSVEEGLAAASRR